MTFILSYISLFPYKRAKQTQDFLQKMINRLCQGQARYGEPTEKQKMLSRMEKELKAYKKSGNAEQLLNIANYALLEFFYPENPKYHFNPNAESVTRK